MVFPPLLKQGDKIVIVAPSGKLEVNVLDEPIRVLTSWGLEVVLGPHVYDRNGYFAGTDSDRLVDLQWALDDSSIAAVLFARGGYGATRILDDIDFTTFVSHSKWLIGFSDITALHLRLQTLGIAGIHGPMGTSFSQSGAQTSIDKLQSLLFTGKSELVSATPMFRSGTIEAEITGGNLALIVDSLMTSNEISTNNKILFIEEVGEKTYRIDRMLRQLLRAGKLENIAGLVLGHFSMVDDGESSFGASWKEVIMDVVDKFSFPVSFGFKIGHEPDNMPIIIGATYRLAATEEESILIRII